MAFSGSSGGGAFSGAGGGSRGGGGSGGLPSLSALLTASSRGAASRRRAAALAEAFKEQAKKDREEDKGWFGNAVDQLKETALGIDDAAKVIGKAAWHDAGLTLGDKDYYVSALKQAVSAGKWGEDDEVLVRFREENKLGGEVGKSIVDSMKHLYGPLFEGDGDEFMRRWKEEPLSPVLDVLTVLSAGAGAVGKGATITASVGKGGKVAQGAAKVAGAERRIEIPERRFVVGPEGATSTTAQSVDRAAEIAKLDARYGGRSGGRVIEDAAGGVYVPRPRTLATPKGRIARRLEKDAKAGVPDAQKALDNIDGVGLTRELGGLSSNGFRRFQQQAYDMLSERMPYAPIVGADKRLRAAARREAKAAKARFTDSRTVAKSTGRLTATTGTVSRIANDPVLREAFDLEAQGVRPLERAEQLRRDRAALEAEDRTVEQLKEQRKEVEQIQREATKRAKKLVDEGVPRLEAAQAAVREIARERIAARTAPVAATTARAAALEGKAEAVRGKYRRVADDVDVDEQFVRQVDGERLHMVDEEAAARLREARTIEREAAVMKMLVDRGAGVGRDAAAAVAKRASVVALRRALMEARLPGHRSSLERRLEDARAATPEQHLERWERAAGAATIGDARALLQVALERAGTAADEAKAWAAANPADTTIVGRGPGRGVRVAAIEERRGEIKGRAEAARSRAAEQAEEIERRFTRELQRIADDPASVPELLSELETWTKAVDMRELIAPRMEAREELARLADKLPEKERAWVDKAIEQLGPALDAMHESLLASGFQPNIARRMLLAQLTVGRKLSDATVDGVKILPHSIEGDGLRAKAADVRRGAKPGRTSSMHHNSGMSWRFALSATDPKAIASVLDANAEFLSQLRWFREIEDQRLVIPFDADPPAGFVVPRKDTLEQFARVVRRFRDEQAPLIFPDNPVAEQLVNRMQSFVDNVAEKRDRTGYVVIPEKYAKALDDEMQRSVTAAGKAFDQATGIWRWATLALRPAWTAANIFGNAITLMLSHNAYDAIRFVLQASADPELRRIFEKHGGAVRTGGGSILKDTVDQARGYKRPKGDRAASSTSLREGLAIGSNRRVPWGKLVAESTVLPGVARFNVWLNQITDDMFRRAAFYAEISKPASELAARKGISFAEAAETLVSDPRVLSQVERRVMGDMIDFSDLSRFERAVVRRASPFYGFIKGMTKREIQFAIEHPGMSAAAYRLAAEYGDDAFDMPVPEFLQGAIPLPKALEDLLGVGQDDEHEGVLVTGSFNPFQTPADAIGQLQTILDPSKEAGFGPDSPLASLNPFFRAPLEASFGRDMFSGEEVPGQSFIDRLRYQGARSTPVSKQLLDLRRAAEDPEWADRKLFRTTPKLELYKYLGIPVRDVNVDLAERLGDSPRRSIIADYPTLRDDGTYASYYSDPRTGAIFAIRPFMPEEEEDTGAGG